jgi:hypothetical protein
MVMKSTGLVPIRLRIDVQGEFHGMSHPRRNTVVDVEPEHARRYFALGFCQPAEVRELGEPYKPFAA